MTVSISGSGALLSADIKVQLLLNSLFVFQNLSSQRNPSKFRKHILQNAVVLGGQVDS